MKNIDENGRKMGRISEFTVCTTTGKTLIYVLRS